MANQMNNTKGKRTGKKGKPAAEIELERKKAERRAARRSGEPNLTTSPRLRARKQMSPEKYSILILVSVALTLLLAISTYFSNEKNILGVIRRFAFGLFGAPTYILPILLFVAILYKAFNQGNQRLDDKIKQGALAFVNLSVLFHIFYVRGAQIHLKLGAKYLALPALANFFRVSGRHRVGGGFFGGLFGDILMILFGKWGAVVIAFFVILALILILVEVSFVQVLTFLRNGLLAFFRWIRKTAAQWGQNHQEDETGWEQDIIAAELSQKGEQVALNEVAAENLARAEGGESKPKKNIFKNFVVGLGKAVQPEEDRPEASDLEALSEQEAATSEAPANEVSEGQMPEVADTVETAETVGEDADKVAEIEQLEEVESEAVISETGQVGGERQDFDADVRAEAIDNPAEPSPQAKPAQEKAAETKAAEEKPVAQSIQEELKLNAATTSYSFPPLELLKEPTVSVENQSELIENNAKKLEETLQSFGVSAKVINVSQGPTVTRYEIQPAQGVKVSRIVNLADDIALNLAAAGIRMEAPIPGKSAIGIEVPNREAGSVMLREVIGSGEFEKSTTKLSFGLGKDITGRALITDIGKMPHLLIAGATGSGKSVCINTLIVSLLYKSKPEEVRLLMIDPKVVELSVYNGIPHLLIPVVTDPKKAAGALNWAVQEMNDRYKLFAAAGVRDLKGYNQALEQKGDGSTPKLPQIVIIVDELADLMMVASNEVEDAICRLAQMARAAGLHLIIATQRPSVDVITGLIKANIPSRIAFNVSSGTDSRTILDMNGAEKLLGKGDMLFYPVGYPKPVRIQGAFISDHEVENIVEYLKTQQQTRYNQKIMNHLNKSDEVSGGNEPKDDLDEFFADALELVVDKERASASMLQRFFRIGFNRAARILDQLTEAGYVGEEQGSKPREVLITRRELEALKRKAKEGGSQTATSEAAAADTAVNSPTPQPTSEESGLSQTFEIKDYDGAGEDEEINDSINEILEEMQKKEELC